MHSTSTTKFLFAFAYSFAAISISFNASANENNLCTKPDDDPNPTVYVFDADDTPASATLKDIEWMRGSWVGCFDGAITEFTVFDEAHDHIPGYSRIYNAEHIWTYIITAFIVDGDSISYKAKHFDSEFTSREGQTGYSLHRLVKIAPNVVYLDRHTYRLKNENEMVLYYEFDGDRTGEITQVHMTRKQNSL